MRNKLISCNQNVYVDQIELKRLHINKKGIRVFGAAESFSHVDNKSNWSAIVMRRDLIVDGLSFGSTTIEGDDATENIVTMWKRLDRNDIACIFLDGLVVSMYNIIDGEKIFQLTGLPVVAITFRDSKGLEDSITHHFRSRTDKKLERYLALGNRESILLRTGKRIYVRYWGSSYDIVKKLLDIFTLQGAIPEPIRLAKLLARESGKHFLKNQK